MQSYRDFIAGKAQLDGDHGFDPIWIPDTMKPFQVHLSDWLIRKGRGACFADCGLGKTFIELVFAENVHRHTNKPVLVLTPLAVAQQHIREAEKFGIEAERSSDGKHSKGIVVTNYQRLHHFDPNDFAAVVCDESSILKNFDGATKHIVTEFMRRIPYRLLATATAAPNDYWELGTSSEALGYLGHNDMITRFFKQETVKDFRGWNRAKYRFRGHAEEPFWQWVCSWAMACRKPSDLGFDDLEYLLPHLAEREIVLDCSKPLPGMLFARPAKDLHEQRRERKETIQERCEAAADIANKHDGSSLVWCNLNPEGDLLAKLCDDAVQVSGSMSDEAKEEALIAFQDGQIRTLVTKPKIGCWGLNFQHCHNVVTFPTHSFEQYYQGVRRCWRFGQKHPVTVTVVTTEGERGVLDNLRRKADQANEMFDALLANMLGAKEVERGYKLDNQGDAPTWLPSLTKQSPTTTPSTTAIA